MTEQEMREMLAAAIKSSPNNQKNIRNGYGASVLSVEALAAMAALQDKICGG